MEIRPEINNSIKKYEKVQTDLRASSAVNLVAFRQFPGKTTKLFKA